MNAERALQRPGIPASWLLGVLISAAFSIAAAAAVYRLQEFAAAIAVFVALLGVTLWRPRYGLYAAVLLALCLEGQGQPKDLVMYWGWIFQTSISTWSPLGFMVITPLELLVVVLVLSTLGRSVVNRGALSRNQLTPPMLIFFSTLTVSFIYGVATGGRTNIALWEIRPLLLTGAIAAVLPTLLSRREDVEQLFKILIAGAVFLSIDIIVRRHTLLASFQSGQFDLAYDHESPVVINFVVILLLARNVWPSSKRAGWSLLLIPLLVYAEMVTERRAGWIGLDVGMLFIALCAWRLRRRVFYFIVFPLLLFYLGYVGAFWNAQGTVAQPVRAVRSLVSPDPRDQASDLYRLIETNDVRQNIRAHPLTGLGFGKAYIFYYPLPDLSWWPFWHYEAHNTILWLWMEMGVFGFCAFLGLIGSAIIRGLHVLRQCVSDSRGPILVAAVSGLLMICVFSYVDVGMTSARIGMLFGLILGVIGAWSPNATARGPQASRR